MSSNKLNGGSSKLKTLPAVEFAKLSRVVLMGDFCGTPRAAKSCIKELQLSVWLLFASFTPASGLANLAKAFWSVRPIKFPGPGFSLPFANAIVTLSSLEALAAKLAKPIAAVAVLDKSTNGPVFAEPVVVVTVKRSSDMSGGGSGIFPTSKYTSICGGVFIGRMPLPLLELLIAESKIEWDGSPNIEELLPNFGGFWPKREPLGNGIDCVVCTLFCHSSSCALLVSSSSASSATLSNFEGLLHDFPEHFVNISASVFCCGRPFKKPSLSEDSTAAGLGNIVVLGMSDKLVDVVEDVVKVNTPLVGVEPALKAKSTFGVMISLFEILATGKLKRNFWAKSERKRPLVLDSFFEIAEVSDVWLRSVVNWVGRDGVNIVFAAPVAANPKLKLLLIGATILETVDFGDTLLSLGEPHATQYILSAPFKISVVNWVGKDGVNIVFAAPVAGSPILKLLLIGATILETVDFGDTLSLVSEAADLFKLLVAFSLLTITGTTDVVIAVAILKAAVGDLFKLLLANGDAVVIFLELEIVFIDVLVLVTLEAEVDDEIVPMTLEVQFINAMVLLLSLKLSKTAGASTSGLQLNVAYLLKAFVEATDTAALLLSVVPTDEEILLMVLEIPPSDSKC
uniref:Uncharacterized protein n=1 Tax=Glossina palpalis gambiensis TaxID=67801 RepID=A0A1B0B791_9MUSC